MTDSPCISPMYRMPIVFGPSAGPRQGPGGEPFDWKNRPERWLASVSFLTDADLLQRYVPPSCQLDGEAVVTVEVQNWIDLPWLNGRGYNTLGVKIPVRVRADGQERRVSFLSVIWENMPDAIITGREELGYNKLYAEVGDLQQSDDSARCAASWFGQEFFSLTLSGLASAGLQDLPAVRNDGVLNWKYVPGTGQDAPPDANYLTLSPPGGHTKYQQLRLGKGAVSFADRDWSQMPTQFHIIRALARLPQLDTRHAFLAQSVGARDLSDMIRLDVDMPAPRFEEASQ